MTRRRFMAWAAGALAGLAVRPTRAAVLPPARLHADEYWDGHGHIKLEKPIAVYLNGFEVTGRCVSYNREAGTVTVLALRDERPSGEWSTHKIPDFAEELTFRGQVDVRWK